MKKWMAVMMAAVMAVSAAGCGGTSAETDTTAASGTEAADTAADASAAGDDGADNSDGAENGDAAGNGGAEDGADAGSDKVYQIATDITFKPFEFENDNGEMVGIDLDLLKAIAEDQGFTYELQVVGFNAAVMAMETGAADAVIAGMSITPERQELYDFSDPYFESGVGCAVLSTSDATDYSDFAGKQVAAKTATEGCRFAESIADEYGFTVVQFDTSAMMYQDVLAGNSVACFEDYPVMGYEIRQGMDLKLLDKLEASNNYGIAVMKGENGELLDMINAGLANLKASGEYDAIIGTYIQD